MADQSSPPPNFGTAEVNYKTIRDTGIPVSIWFPKLGAKQQKCPIIVRWHGGGLVTGSRLAEIYLADWIPQLVEREKAIFIAPDYRLLPEANGLEMLEDNKDFWSWLLGPGQLEKHLPANISPELDHLLVVGESGGGFMALHSALSPAADHIGAVILQYPLIDVRAPHYSEAYEKKIFDPPFPQLDPQIFKDHMATIRHDQPPVTSGSGPDRSNVLFVVAQQGLFVQLLGQDSSIYPLEVLPSLNSLPPIWFIHGIGDTVVPIEGTVKFIDNAKSIMPDWAFHTSFRPGEHLLDKNKRDVSLETDWMAEGIAFVRKFWIRT